VRRILHERGRVNNGRARQAALDDLRLPPEERAFGRLAERFVAPVALGSVFFLRRLTAGRLLLLLRQLELPVGVLGLRE
jgi:hypothetical protein